MSSSAESYSDDSDDQPLEGEDEDLEDISHAMSASDVDCQPHFLSPEYAARSKLP